LIDNQYSITDLRDAAAMLARHWFGSRIDPDDEPGR
jgi:hypothetical protein